MYLTYIGIILLLLTLTVSIIVIAVYKHNYHVGKLNLNNYTLCKDIECVFEVLTELLRELYCKYEHVNIRIRGVCRVVLIQDNSMLVCCDSVCRLIKLECNTSLG